ncbi:MAG: hydroxymethylbilane synthase [Sandaracinaceae bacterium]|nr:hydroxymethylbilane synthase [Sandaracinaceae bacterium]
MTQPLRIATRKSPLALAQTRMVGELIRAHAPGLEIEEVHVVTEGDRVLDKPLAKVGGKGLFVSEVEAALADGRADIAVHSMKDVPEALLPGMTLACVPEREDPRDGLVTRDGSALMDLVAGAKIGTSSLRRAIQLRRERNDVAFHVLRGNVGTRLSRVRDEALDAAVLALAGMRRLGLGALGLKLVDGPIDSRTTKPAGDARLTVTPLSVEVSIPAVGQGALAIEAREGDARVAALLAPLEHRRTRIAVEAERAFLQTLHGSCSTPLAAHARIDEGMLRMDGMVGSLDGDTVLAAGTAETFELDSAGAEGRARVIGTQLAERLLANGAGAIIDAARSESDPYRWLYAR